MFKCTLERNFICSPHLWFVSNPRGKMWTEPEELVAARISGSCNDGANDNENMVDGYVPLRKLYDWENKGWLDSIYDVKIWVDINTDAMLLQGIQWI